MAKFTRDNTHITLPFFLKPLRDESFYSLVARWFTQFPAATPTKQLLLTIGKQRISYYWIQLPRIITPFVDRVIAPEAELTALKEQLLTNNTLYHFYAWLLPPDYVDKFRQFMLYEITHDPMRIGYSIGQIKIPHLRYCPACVEADRQQYGFTYWRIFQLPTMQWCPYHELRLLDSHFIFPKPYTAHQFETAQTALNGLDMTWYSPQSEREVQEVQIARSINWLLQTPPYDPPAGSFQMQFLHLLDKEGVLATTARETDKRLRERLQDVTHSLLTDRHLWPPNHWFRDWQPDIHIRRPLPELGKIPEFWDIALLQELGYSLPQFYALTNADETGSWPCLNPVCDWYHKDAITSRSLPATGAEKHDPSFWQWRSYCCPHCGYTYRRHLTNPSRSIKVERFGRLWEQAFLDHYTNSNYSSEHIQHHFHLSENEYLQILVDQGLIKTGVLSEAFCQHLNSPPTQAPLLELT